MYFQVMAWLLLMILSLRTWVLITSWPLNALVTTPPPPSVPPPNSSTSMMPQPQDSWPWLIQTSATRDKLELSSQCWMLSHLIWEPLHALDVLEVRFHTYSFFHLIIIICFPCLGVGRRRRSAEDSNAQAFNEAWSPLH